MERPSPLPVQGDVFLDARGDDRVLRVSWHPEPSVVVLSLWRGRSCVGTFRMPVEDAPALIEMLRACLGQAYDSARDSILSPFFAFDDEHVG